MECTGLKNNLNQSAMQSDPWNVNFWQKFSIFIYLILSTQKCLVKSNFKIQNVFAKKCTVCGLCHRSKSHVSRWVWVCMQNIHMAVAILDLTVYIDLYVFEFVILKKRILFVHTDRIAVCVCVLMVAFFSDFKSKNRYRKIWWLVYSIGPIVLQPCLIYYSKVLSYFLKQCVITRLH